MLTALFNLFFTAYNSMAYILEELSGPVAARSTSFSAQVNSIDHLCRSIGLPAFTQIRSKDSNYISYHQLPLNKCNLLIKLSLDHQQLTLSIRQITGKGYEMIPSKTQQSLLLKQIAKMLKMRSCSLKFCVKEGCLVGRVQYLIQQGYFYRNKKMQVLKNIISMNLISYSIFSSEYRNKICGRLEKGSNKGLKKNFKLFSILNTITLSHDIIDQTYVQNQQYQLSVEENHAIDQIQRRTEDQSFIERVQSLYCEIIEQESEEQEYDSRRELERMCATMEIQSKKKDSRPKRLEEFNLNMVRLQVKAMNPRPVNVGGSSLIFFMKASVVFISSNDGKAYNYQTVQKELAVKRLKPQLKQKLKDKVMHEKSILNLLKNSCCNYIPCYYVTQNNKPFSQDIIMDAIRGQQLHSFLQKRRATISLWTKIYILCNIFTALNYLNEHSIVHLDLKPANILVSALLAPKILDFGQAYHPHLCKKDYLPGYTFPYVAPEVFQAIVREKSMKFEFSQKQDVFAIGMILFEVIFSRDALRLNTADFKTVYKESRALDRVHLSIQEAIQFGPEPHVSTLTRLILQCIDPNPSRRPTLFWTGATLKKMLRSYVEG